MDPQHQWLTTTFQLSEEEIDTIVRDQQEDWKQLLTKDQLSVENEAQQDGTSRTQPGIPQEEYNLSRCHHDSDKHSSVATLTNLNFGDKRKDIDIEKKGRKKKNNVRDSTPSSLTDEDYNLLVDRMAEDFNETYQKIDNRHTELFGGVINLLQTICKSMK